MPAKTTVQPPINISDVIARAVKLNRLRNLPASSPVTTTPALPAAKSRPICRLLASSRSSAKSTSSAKVEAVTKLIKAIISEMFRSTGWEST